MFEKKREDYQHPSSVKVCKKCGCVVGPNRGKKVMVVSYILRRSEDYEDYCDIHKPEYSRVVVTGYSGVSYYREMLVDVNGDPVGYRKIKKAETQTPML